MKPVFKKIVVRTVKVLLVFFAILFVALGVIVGIVLSKPKLDENVRKTVGKSYIELSGGVTHYEWNKVSDTAPLVVLFQGVTVPMFVYDNVVPALNAAGFSTLRFDYYGRGYSDRPMMTYTTELYADQGRELLEALKIKGRVHMVCISLGGAVVSRIVSAQPERALSVTMIGPAVAFTKERADEQKWKFIKERAKVFKKDEPPSGDPALADAEAFKPIVKEQFSYRGMEWAFISMAMNENQFTYLEQYKKLAQVKGVPIAFIWGENDNHFPVSDGRRLAGLFKGAEFHVIEGGGHTPHYGQSALTNPVLIGFLKKVENSQSAADGK